MKKREKNVEANGEREKVDQITTTKNVERWKWMNWKWKLTKRFFYSTLKYKIDVSTTFTSLYPCISWMKPIKVDLSLFYLESDPVKLARSPLIFITLSTQIREESSENDETKTAKCKRTQVMRRGGEVRKLLRIRHSDTMHLLMHQN